MKELIPEFYMPGGQFLVNSLFLDFGLKQDGSKVATIITITINTHRTTTISSTHIHHHNDIIASRLHDMF